MPRSSGSGSIKRDLALRKQPVPKRGWRRRFQSRTIRNTRPAVPGAGSRRGSSQRSATRSTTVPAKARPRRSSQITAVFAKAHPGRRQRAFEALRSTGLVAARSASSSDSSRLFERSERSERSELRDGLRDRAPQGSRSAAETASTKRCRLPGCAFANTAVICEERRGRAFADTVVLRVALRCEDPRREPAPGTAGRVVRIFRAGITDASRALEQVACAGQGLV